MARKIFIAGNWKMNKTAAETKALCEALKESLAPYAGKVEVAVCPTFTSLATAVEILKGSNVKVGAQNIHWADNGAFTGEISGEMLKTAWRGNFRRLLALNRDIMLRSLLLQLCFGAITVLGARLGSDIIAVNAVLMTLLTFTAYALDGFAYAVEAHSGQAYGARDGSQLLDVWRAACRQSGIVALLFSVVYLLAGEHIIALLTSLTQIQELADRYLIWQVILPLVGVWCYLLDGMFIGATRAAEMRNSMAVAAAGFALTLLTLPWLGNHGLWLALTVFLALRGLSLAAIWRRHWRNGTWFAAT